jgi:toxin YoeB
MRKIALEGKSLEHLRFYLQNDIKLLKKCFELFEAIQADPFKGIGKPEPLRGELQGYWSRRINDEHRIVYAVTNEYIIVISCRSHYRI